jgi:hypothetical protein
LKGLGFIASPFRGLVGALRTTGRTVAVVPDLVDAILVLPTLSRQLEDVKVATAKLPDILVELERVHGDTAALPVMNADIGRLSATVAKVEAHTLAVEQLAEIALPLQGAAVRVGRFADKLPQRRGLRSGA